MSRWISLLTVSAVVLGLSAAASYRVFSQQRDDLLNVARKDLSNSTAAFVHASNGIFEPGLTVNDAIMDSGIRFAKEADQSKIFFAISTGVVRRHAQISRVFLAFPDGRFFHVQGFGTSELTSIQRWFGCVN